MTLTPRLARSSPTFWLGSISVGWPITVIGGSLTYEEARTLFSEPDPIGQNCVGDLTGQSSADPIVCTHPVFGPDRGTWVVENMLYSPSVPRDYWNFSGLTTNSGLIPPLAALRYVPCEVRCGNSVIALLARDAAPFGSPFICTLTSEYQPMLNGNCWPDFTLHNNASV